jgi:hypothetical protein
MDINDIRVQRQLDENTLGSSGYCCLAGPVCPNSEVWLLFLTELVDRLNAFSSLRTVRLLRSSNASPRV